MERENNFLGIVPRKEKRKYIETNYITSPHVNVFYYIIATPKLVTKYFNELESFSEISSILCIFISAMKTSVIIEKKKMLQTQKAKMGTTNPYPQVTIKHLLKTVLLSG